MQNAVDMSNMTSYFAANEPGFEKKQKNRNLKVSFQHTITKGIKEHLF